LRAACQRFSGESVSSPPWYASEKGVLQKAGSIGLTAHPGELLNEFKVNIEPTQSKLQRSAMLKASLQRAKPPATINITNHVSYSLQNSASKQPMCQFHTNLQNQSIWHHADQLL
jgi:hypothetical protein